MRLDYSWRHWDYKLWLAGCADRETLAQWVAQPHQFIMNRRQTALTFSDQVPVWLKPSAGKMLAPVKKIKLAREQRKRRELARKHGKAITEQQEVTQKRGPGSSSAGRWRVSLVARQAIEDYFEEGREPTGPLMLMLMQ